MALARVPVAEIDPHPGHGSPMPSHRWSRVTSACESSRIRSIRLRWEQSRPREAIERDLLNVDRVLLGPSRADPQSIPPRGEGRYCRPAGHCPRIADAERPFSLSTIKLMGV
jgi:hypothetical protein